MNVWSTGRHDSSTDSQTGRVTAGRGTDRGFKMRVGDGQMARTRICSINTMKGTMI